MKPKAILVPFGYPDYPREVVEKFLAESKATLSNLNIELTTTSLVNQEKDVEKVVKEIRQNPHDFIIALLVSWIEAPNLVATLRDFFNEPILLWSHTTYKEDGTTITLGALPAAGVVRETLEEMGVNFKFIYGMPNSSKIGQEVESFARVAQTIRALSRSRIGLFGYFSMGMYTGGFDHTKVRSKIGPEIVHLGQYYLIKEEPKVNLEKARSLIDKAKKEWELNEDVDDETLLKVMKFYLALRNLVEEYSLDALTVKCQYELSRLYGFAPCVSLSMLADEVTCSCEGDMPLVISQLILRYLTGNVITYGDVHDILEDNSIIVGACGFAPLSLSSGKPKIGKHTALYEGLLNMSPYKEGKVTLIRLALDGEGYKMHIVTGEARVSSPFHEINCPPYALMKVILEGRVNSFIQTLMSQHYAIVYENAKKELLEFCRLLKIKPVVVE